MEHWYRFHCRIFTGVVPFRSKRDVNDIGSSTRRYTESRLHITSDSCCCFPSFFLNLKYACFRVKLTFILGSSSASTKAPFEWSQGSGRSVRERYGTFCEISLLIWSDQRCLVPFHIYQHNSLLVTKTWYCKSSKGWFSCSFIFFCTGNDSILKASLHNN